MKVLKKNQVIIFVIALMLIAAGYLNFTTNNQNQDLLATGALADAEEMAGIGDAKLVSSNVVENDITQNTEANVIEENNISEENNIVQENTNVISEETSSEINETDDYFTRSRLDRNTMYSQTLETYQDILESSTVPTEQKSIAQEEINRINNEKNAIMIAENLIKTKGFEDLIIFINKDTASVIVKCKELDEKSIAQIQNIVTRELEIKIENINISCKE